MPVTLKKNVIKIRDNPNSNYTSMDVISDSTTAERVNQINNVSTTALAQINTVLNNINACMLNKGQLTNGIDLNTIKENAIYLLDVQSSAQYVNTPLASGAGYLTVKNNSTTTFQTVESLIGNRYSRYTTDGTTWSAWTE